MIARDGGLFPVAVARGDRLVAVVRGGAGHLGRAGRLELLSSDIGTSWSPPTKIAEGERDCRKPRPGLHGQRGAGPAYQREGAAGGRTASLLELPCPATGYRAVAVSWR